MTPSDPVASTDRRRTSDLDGVRLTAAEAAQRLGVKLPTVYAYVSRGHLHSERAPGGRISTFSGRTPM